MKTKSTRVLLSLGIVLVLVLSEVLGANAKVKIVYLDQSDATRQPVFEAVVKDFMVAHPDIEVEFIGTTENVILPQQRMIAGGTPPDVVYTHQGAFPMFALRNGYLSLNSFINRDKFDLNAYDKTILGYFTVKDQIYAIPRDRHTNILYYNSRLFDEAGVDYPSHIWNDPNWTWDKLIEIGKKLTIDKNGDGKIDQFGYEGGCGYAGWYQLVISYGGQWFDKEYTKTLIGETSAAADAFQMLSDLQWKYNIVPQPGQIAEIAGGAWMGGRIAMVINGTWGAMWYGEGMKEHDLKWDYAPIPMQLKAAVNYFPSGLSISKGSKHPEEAWSLIKFLSQGEPLKQLVSCIKGIPPRKDMIKWWKDFAVKDFKYSVDVDVVWNAFEYAVKLPTTPGWEEVQAVVNAELDKLFLPEEKKRKTGAEVVASLIPKLDKVLLESKE